MSWRISLSDRRMNAVRTIVAVLWALGACARTPAHRVEPSVSVGGTETCAVTARGAAFCWGLRYGASDTVHPVPAPPDVRTIEIGTFRACAVDLIGRALCTFDMFGRPVPRDCPVGVCLYPVRHATGAPYARVSMGERHACALDMRGAAYCWGAGDYGQLGDGMPAPSAGTARREGLAPAPVMGGLTLSAISAGEMHTCALTDERRAYCWGQGQAGEIGNDSIMSSCVRADRPERNPCQVNTPIPVRTDQRFVAISAGRRLTCAISVAGAVYCWGGNQRCALGTCEGASSSIPVRISLPKRAIVVSAGARSACAILTDRRAYCWGDNRAGQLGSPVQGPWGVCPMGGRCSPRPTQVGGNHRWRAISIGDLHACGISVKGALYCWGARSEGRLPGVRSTEICRNNSPHWKDEPCASTPVPIPLGSPAGTAASEARTRRERFAASARVRPD